MPELPEVETVRRGLQAAIEGKTIVSAKTYRSNLRVPFPEHLVEQLLGRKVITVRRRAKYLLFDLSDNLTLINHLGMTGSWKIEQNIINNDFYKKGDYSLHDHFALQLKGVEPQLTTLIFNDPRRFGMVLLCESDRLRSHPLLAKLGIEPLSDDLTATFLQKAFFAKTTTLKAALLDQTIVSGLGNIYCCEALWRSSLSPFRQARTLADQANNDRRLECLVQNIKKVLQEAIAAGGSSLRDYKHVDGSLGYFQHKFCVYSRVNEPCLRCGAPLLRTKQNGRSTFYCGVCQT